MLFLRSKSEIGSGLIWFICLLGIVTLFSGTLVSASSQYVTSRALTDFAEQFALALKTQLNQEKPGSIDVLAKNLIGQVAGKYHFRNLRLEDVKLEYGGTVHVLACLTWESPFQTVLGEQELCEEAYAR